MKRHPVIAFYILAFVISWLYEHTNGSLLFVSSYAFVVGLMTVAAMAIVLTYGPRRFIKSGRPA